MALIAAGFPWEAGVFLVAIIGIPVVVAAVVGGRAKK
jgi:hypothetical protein